MDSDIFAKILSCIVSIAIIIITRYAIPYVKTVIDTQKLNMIYDIAMMAVNASEQKYNTPGTGKMKKLDATEFIKSLLHSMNINLTNEQISDIIESAVYELKQAKEE